MKDIFEKYLKHECTLEEVQRLVDYLKNSEDLSDVPSVEIIYDILSKYPDMKEKEANLIFNNVIRITKNKKKPIKILFHLRKYAAIIILGVLVTGYFFKDQLFKNQISIIVHKKIPFGTEKAVLTLSNGKEIELNKNEIYHSANIKSNGKEIIYKKSTATKTATVYNYLTIPRGGQFTIKLSDGTQVWLNSETKLKYPINFVEGKSRKVELMYGEAYFDVSHSTEHKGANFKVYHNQQEIQVLGTEFNVKAYKDETNVYTTLVKGKVAIKTTNKSEILVPNEQSIFNINNNSLTVSKVDIDDEISWRKCLFSFKSMPLKEIMKVLSRWYDVDVKFKDAKTEQVKFNGILNRNQSLEEILSIIQSTNFIKDFKINDKEIIIE